MEFRKTEEKDLNRVMEIIKQAQEYFRENQVDQWKGGYPDRQTIKEDMANGESYVLVKEEKVIGTAAISFAGEATYDQIYHGEWLSHGEYAVIHRLAVDGNYKGLGISSEMMGCAESMCLERAVHSIKIDTHRDNKPMQRLLEKNEFTYCGVIYLEDGSERVAFEKLF